MKWLNNEEAAINQRALDKIRGHKVAEGLVDAILVYCDKHPNVLIGREVHAAFQVARDLCEHYGTVAPTTRATNSTKHPNPGCEMGDVVTLQATTKPHRGKKVTGRFTRYNPKSGKCEILVNQTLVRGWFHSREK